jgi:hypothetical protein
MDSDKDYIYKDLTYKIIGLFMILTKNWETYIKKLFIIKQLL